MFKTCLFSFFILSSATAKSKLCSNCKYFLPNENKMYSRCLKFPKVENTENLYQRRGELLEFLTNSSPTPFKPKCIEYNYCAFARSLDYMCGKEGKSYEERI